jgi:phosphoglycerol transferase MdoB-like AlkP superfamily enzyme
MVYGYVFMEWLFFATKSSFMDVLPFGKKLEVFLLTGLVLAVFALVPFAAFRLLGLIPGPTRNWRIFQLLAALIPALLVAALSLLLIDNFTYTLFHFGIVNSQGAVRAGYAVLVVVLIVVWYRQVLKNASSKPPAEISSGQRRLFRLWNPAFELVALLVAVSLLIGLIRIFNSAGLAGESNAVSQRQPNIILLGGDGLDAQYMSLYGYGRETTPNLEQLAETGLLAENNFTNAAHTTGSVFSILTGKYPADTRLLYSPNILQGLDAYQHLPGILQRAGYTTVQITFPYYIDAYAVNMQEGFDEVNGRSLDQGEIFRFARQIHWEDVGYFLPRLSERIFDRLLHVFFIREMPDPYGDVMATVDPNSFAKLSDQQRMYQLIRTLREAKGPVFVHVHLMGTHGPMFNPRKQVFSAGEIQSRDWMQDFFDDAILDFDAYVGEFVKNLKAAGLWDNTVLIVYSDHVDNWQTNGRIPLLFHFPGGEYARRIRANTQNLDISPTILDYLGMEKPAWMSGQSLLEGEPPLLRPIISAGVTGVDCRPPDWWCVIDPTISQPPFYQFGYLQVVVCQKMYILNLRNNSFLEKKVAGHTAPCPAADLPSQKEIRLLMLEHLRRYGFDVSSLE